MSVEQNPTIWGTKTVAATSNVVFDTITMLPNGGYVLPLTQNGKIIFQIYDGNGAAVGAAHSIAAPINTAQWQPDIYTKTDGSFVITWTEAALGNSGGRVVRSQAFDMHGTALDAGTTISTTANKDGVETTTDGNNGLMTAYIDEISANNFQLKLVETKSDGTHVASTITAATGDVSLDSLGGANGYVATYFNNNGAVVVGIVKDGALTKTASIANVAEANVVALKGTDGNPNGKFVVTYYTTDRFAKIATFHLDATGSIVQDSTVQIANPVDSNGLKTSIVALQDGGFAVAYKDGNAGATSDIWVKVFDADGNAGPALQIPISGLQTTPSISEMADGRLSVSWNNWSPPTGGSTIETVIVDARAHAMTVIGTSANDIYNPSKHQGDDFDGGAGIDTLTFKESTAAVNVSLELDAAHPGVGGGFAGDATGDTYKNFENVIGSRFNDTITGSTGTNKLEGGAGNDEYHINDTSDVVVEAANNGIDLIYTSATHTLEANVENMIATGADAITLVGNELNNTLIGNAAANILQSGAGNDVLNGGEGADRMEGGIGNDVYYVDNAGDLVIDTSGVDTVYTSISYTLASTADILRASGTAGLALTGNALANTIYGNAGSNRIDGGNGKDVLYGGAGKDTFVFDTKASSSNVDKIADYNVTYDTIWLDNKYFTKLGSGTASSPKKLASSAFYKGAKAHDSNDHIIYNPTNGYLYYDADGTGSSKQVLIATMAKNLKMTYAEFFVI